MKYVKQALPVGSCSTLASAWSRSIRSSIATRFKGSCMIKGFVHYIEKGWTQNFAADSITDLHAKVILDRHEPAVLDSFLEKFIEK